MDWVNHSDGLGCLVFLLSGQVIMAWVANWALLAVSTPHSHSMADTPVSSFPTWRLIPVSTDGTAMTMTLRDCDSLLLEM